MSKPTISVIIPHYNSKEYLVRAINSVVDRAEVEVVVIDNSPTPLRREDLIGVKRQFVLGHSPYGKGAGCARNAGLDKASGKYIIFMDADDMLCEGSDLIIDEFIATDMASDITYFATRSIYNDTGEASPRADIYNKHLNNYIASQTLRNEEKLKFYHLTPWSKIYRRDVIDRSGARFDEVAASNDLYFCTTVALNAHSIKADRRSLYTVTSQKSGTLTTTLSSKNARSRHNVLLRQGNLFRSYGKPQFASLPLVTLKALMRVSYKDFLWGIAEIFRQKNNPLLIAYHKFIKKEFK